MTTQTPPFGLTSLQIDAELEVAKVTRSLSAYLARSKRRGAVVALSGGIDSSTVAALCVAALGKDRVFGLHMPERESSPETIVLSRLLAEWLGIDSTLEDITAVLEGAGCYRRRDDAIRKVCPDYGPGCKSKIVLPSVIDSDSFRLFSVVVMAPDGAQAKHRLTAESYLGIVAATNFKQRVRKVLEYYHADRLNYVVTGTPNRLEYDQGFFVKLGDGSADVKPIAHLYKSQVYALAEYLGIPEEIRSRPPTTDTYSLPQSQEEFYFSLPYALMDLCLFGKNNGVPVEDIADATDLTVEQVNRVFRDIDRKRKATEYMHIAPALAGDIPEVSRGGDWVHALCARHHARRRPVDFKRRGTYTPVWRGSSGCPSVDSASKRPGEGDLLWEQEMSPNYRRKYAEGAAARGAGCSYRLAEIVIDNTWPTFAELQEGTGLGWSIIARRLSRIEGRLAYSHGSRGGIRATLSLPLAVC